MAPCRRSLSIGLAAAALLLLLSCCCLARVEAARSLVGRATPDEERKLDEKFNRIATMLKNVPGVVVGGREISLENEDVDGSKHTVVLRFGNHTSGPGQDMVSAQQRIMRAKTQEALEKVARHKRQKKERQYARKFLQRGADPIVNAIFEWKMERIRENEAGSRRSGFETAKYWMAMLRDAKKKKGKLPSHVIRVEAGVPGDVYELQGDQAKETPNSVNEKVISH